MRADDPADLGSPLSYAGCGRLSKSRQWVLTELRAGGHMQTVKQLGDRLAQAGHPLKPRTIQAALGQLEAAGWRRERGRQRPGPLLVGHRPPVQSLESR